MKRKLYYFITSIRDRHFILTGWFIDPIRYKFFIDVMTEDTNDIISK